LVGLKENVILGHLIPAGTGFRQYQDSEVRYRPEALQAMAAEAATTLETSFPLLQESASGEAAGVGAAVAPKPAEIDEDITPQETYVPFDDMFHADSDAEDE
jgi:DNA-directed RNA polymerase subunit beta'